MTPEWNSSGVLGGPDRRHGDRRGHSRGTIDRRRRRRGVRTAMLAAAMSSTPAVRPAIAIFPTAKILQPQVDVATEFEILPPSEAYEEIIQEAATEYGVEAALIRAVMQAESAFHPYAVSRAGAEGLMQLMPELADEMGVSDSFDPRENIMGGVRYLKRLRKRGSRNGCWMHTVAAGANNPTALSTDRRLTTPEAMVRPARRLAELARENDQGSQ